MTDPILYESLPSGIARIVLNRAESRNAQDTALVTEHKIKLTGLDPNTKYYYTIGSFLDTLAAGAVDYFVTLPPAGSEAGKRKNEREASASRACAGNSLRPRHGKDWTRGRRSTGEGGKRSRAG